MIDFTHEDIERLWDSVVHYVPERQKLDMAIDFIKSFKESFTIFSAPFSTSEKSFDESNGSLCEEYVVAHPLLTRAVSVSASSSIQNIEVTSPAAHASVQLSIFSFEHLMISLV